MKLKDVKSHTMAIECHNPAASVLVVSFKCVAGSRCYEDDLR